MAVAPSPEIFRPAALAVLQEATPPVSRDGRGPNTAHPSDGSQMTVISCQDLGRSTSLAERETPEGIMATGFGKTLYWTCLGALAVWAASEFAGPTVTAATVDITFSLECREPDQAWDHPYLLRLAYEHGRPVGGTTTPMDDMDVVEATQEHILLRDPGRRKEADINRHTGRARLTWLHGRSSTMSRGRWSGRSES